MADQSLKIPEVQPQSASQPSPQPAPQPPESAKASEMVGGSTGQPENPHYITTKEIVISAGAVLAAAVIFFVIKNYISKMLVSSYRKSPQSADMAGWGLFCLLLLTAIVGVLGILDSAKFMAVPYLVVFGVAMLVSLVVFAMPLLSKR
jgi:undecaprenyl pyrophosphate phosphatase UppP